MQDNWVLKAIEDEAMRRATKAVSTFEPMVMGLSVSQIGALLHGFLYLFGDHPSRLTHKEIYKRMKEMKS